MKRRYPQYVWNILFVILLFAVGSIIFRNDSFSGIVTILHTQDLLLTDYIEVAGLASTLLNVLLVAIFALVLLQVNDVPLNGYTYAGLFTMIGFSFFGKNYFNILPIYLGVYLYAKSKREPFGNYVVVAFFAGCVAPFTSLGWTYGIVPSVFSFLTAILLGFVICSLSQVTKNLHQGYMLYNVGFSGGILAIIIAAVLRTFSIKIDTVHFINTSMTIHYILIALVGFISSYLILVGVRRHGFSWQDYRQLLFTSGRAKTDYIERFGSGVTYVNMGIVGLIQLCVAVSFGLPLNGPLVGAIFTCIGFSAFGNNPKNILPVMLGSALMMFISQTQITPGHVTSILFACGIAPIAGSFGILAGIVGGALHFSLAQFTALWQGGINLYNNGFSLGFVASVIASVMSDHRKKIKHEELVDE